jgi:xanthine/uracil permease
MTANEGTFDRAARVAVGLAVLSLTVVGPKSMWGLVGLVPILTGLLGVCPAYAILGINTCRAPRKA